MKSYTELEGLEFNTNQSIIGYDVTRSWGLPQVPREAYLLHHDIDYIRDDCMGADSSCRNWVVILKIAEHIAVSHRNDADYEWQRYKPHVLGNLGLSEIDYDELKADMIDILNTGDT